MAISRTAFWSRFVVFDTRPNDRPKSGQAYVHFAVPLRSIFANTYARFDQLLIRHNSQTPQKLAMVSASVWDGPDQVACFDNITLLSSPTTVRFLVDTREVRSGVSVALLIRANGARNNLLDVNAVGVSFYV